MWNHNLEDPGASDLILMNLSEKVFYPENDLEIMKRLTFEY
jgi:hypothetical protein